MSHLHPVFHVSLLEPYQLLTDVLHRTPVHPTHIELQSDLSQIETFIDCRKVGRQYNYFIHWKDQPVSERSWIALSDIPSSLNEQLKCFLCRHPKLPRLHRIVLD
ncbi:uncharacterized protein LAESUDRAFT_657044 [Laetiporus sulphureus 93-53]|uniref:Chromo domain-containing protein n=1 Tax=Laetiporus sulphureus 93-53 TaxID=1314785 RepID=A0A165DJG2_9APHY|nr:uncharacterized protein LAESUDRAFT_657044 [Laetiporus sulphureus 93-53]KZT05016.1 hypothetical protein LAESUDRAFT_657044 [Laetiporus sulphureus 93-53]